MTEKDLRAYYVDIARKYHGISYGSSEHKAIVDCYNSHQPLARGYRLQYDDPWCAGFVSAVAIESGFTQIIPTEVGTDPMIRKFQKMERWMEQDSYSPKPGDIIFFDWDDDGIGDNQQSSSHVGIVVRLTNGIIRTIEGNMGDRVWHRDIPVNGRFIRGYGIPDYSKLVKGDTAVIYNSVIEMPDWAKPTIQKLVDRKLLQGDDSGKLNLSLDMVRIFVVHDRAGLYN